MKAVTTPFPQIIRYEDEKYFMDPVTKTKQPFPSINERPKIALSVIVPAFDEEQRCRSQYSISGFDFCITLHQFILI